MVDKHVQFIENEIRNAPNAKLFDSFPENLMNEPMFYDPENSKYADIKFFACGVDDEACDPVTTVS